MIEVKCPRCGAKNYTPVSAWLLTPKTKKGGCVKIMTFTCTKCGLKFKVAIPVKKQ